MKKSKKYEAQEDNKTTDSGEVAKQIAVETIKDTEKLFQRTSNFFKNIWKFLTTPSMILGFFKFEKLDHVYESFLRNERLMKILALVVAIGFALNVRYASTMKERYSVDINSYPLVSYYDKERTVVEGLPDTVDVTLVGDKSQVDIAKTKANFEIYADLKDLPPGTHKVNLEYSKLGSKLDVKIDPSTIVVTIMALTEIDKPVQADFVNLDQIDEMYVLSEPQLALDTVKIKGPQTVVDQVASVKAIIDVSDLSKLSDYEAPVFAYDKLGNKLDVEIKPDKLTASVQVTTPSKVVPVEAVVTGNAPAGYSVGNLTLSPSEVKLYGETSALESYEKLQLQVDLYQLDDNNELIVKLDKPENVHKMDTDTVKVKVTFEETQTKVLENIAVDFKNLDAKYRVKAKDLVDAMINLTLKGSTTKLNSISTDDVKVSIDLLGYKPGEYEVPVTVESITGVIIEPSRSKVNVIITE
ncbi:MAG: CdaR family protein [Turicibacter sp.]|nr:CdaR family protein [Turicibacter sp.]